MYFYVSTSVIDRDDLTLQEKMACVVIARYANQPAFEGLLSVDILALKMGVDSKEAKVALEGLMKKGMIERESVERLEPHHSNVLKNNASAAAASFEPIVESVDKKDIEEEKPVTSDDVKAIFEEVVSKRQALILFELAGRNLTTLKSVYEKTKAKDPFDVIEALADALQGIDSEDDNESDTRVADESGTRSVEESSGHELLSSVETESLFEELEKKAVATQDPTSGHKVNTQINLGRIKSLYQKQQNKK
ncbi:MULTISPECIES: hypothetical protein [unclassified Fusibacter]|uniref:hypothetical protein n=1 Tax=unclassified Fusibacter TaxID=2624464 RepID=UPI001010A318|nr:MULTISPECIES: hypothetical protein [unclassified Fusibacter]MCK8059418.1 hypothetical protein [Fusibacter sp. A2]NPE21118.1 hypothetical protein [Fusibacter sp. A1]RXV62388.1 hypothetical protein DWB64_04730 [Fusibacter sp. A1]